MKKIFLVLVCLSGWFFAKAQPVVLTFEEAIQIALKNGVLLNQQRNNLELNQMQKIGGVAGLGPTLYINGTAQRVNGNTFNQNEGKVVNGVFDQISASVNANWTIFNGFSQLNRMRQANSSLEAQSYYVNRTSQDIINTVSSQYLQVLLDQELVLIANENLEAMKKQLNQVQEMVRVGSRSPVDEYNQDSQTKAAEIRAVQARITLTNDRALLIQTLLLDPAGEYEVAKPDWNVNEVVGTSFELETLYQESLMHRGDYLRAAKNEEAARFGMNAMKGNMMPSLNLFGVLYSAYNNQHGDPNTRPFSDQFRTDNLRKGYGVQLSIPIFGGNTSFQNRISYVQQKVNYENSKVTTENTRVQVKTDVLRAYQNFQLYKEGYVLTEGQLTAAEMAFKLETERYNLGITNLIDFTQANRTFVQAQTDKAQAEYRLLFQKILLNYAVGTLKPENLTD